MEKLATSFFLSKNIRNPRNFFAHCGFLCKDGFRDTYSTTSSGSGIKTVEIKLEIELRELAENIIEELFRENSIIIL